MRHSIDEPPSITEVPAQAAQVPDDEMDDDDEIDDSDHSRRVRFQEADYGPPVKRRIAKSMSRVDADLSYSPPKSNGKYEKKVI
jgi:hypothetical protein